LVPVDGATRAALDPNTGATGRDIQVMLRAVRVEVGADIWSCPSPTGRIGDETRSPTAQAPRVDEVKARPAPGQARAGHDVASTQKRLHQALEQHQTALHEGKHSTDAVPMPVVTRGQGTAVPMPVVTRGQGTAVPMPVVTRDQGTAVPMPVVTRDQGTAVPMPVVTRDQGTAVPMPVLGRSAPDALPGAHLEPLPSARPDPVRAEGERRQEARPEVARRASSRQQASGAREARGQGVGEYTPLREGDALRVGTRGPRVAEHQREVGQDLQRLGLSEEAVRGLLDPGGANRGGPYDGFYGPNTARATQLRDELRRQRDGGQLTPERLRTLERELFAQAAPQGSADTVTPRAQPRVQPDTVTPPVQPAPACHVPGADVRAAGIDGPRAYVPDTIAALYPERTRAPTGPKTSARPLDAAADAQQVIDALVHQGADRIPPRVAYDGGQRVTETGRRHSDEVLGVLQQTGLEYARRAAFGDGTAEERAQNQDFADRIRAAQADYARQVREFWSGRAPNAAEPSAQ
jgi:hypothetical protein